ncbi:phosphate starvation-inducible protein PsiF [Acidovorax sp. Leaf76]|uniref:PsiF family protein n=1 Tax=unclassified Acidovorax TaxID=2684926 RepID=UPI0006F2AF26|nr:MULTISPECIES: PsiF family protein [unclassified Acidovorax]KQO14057.1 phosphate starvation-inducible protein PsiF [Acidovorax sp. Leaf76]KQO31577.1 phosphate starvation-inducible protein PsiF [Acidovorax sp. Leaf84]KQS27596.1 phosphate starvation-inducible protein PsiF [Acidovorax sp. Leaf191]
MKQLISLTALGLALTLGASAHAAEDAKAPTKQQSKMATCNADEKAKTLKGDERKAFMKECLSANKQEKQQTKMKTCNADEKAKTLKGDERKAFMSECLKG